MNGMATQVPLCTGRALRQLRGGYIICECGAMVRADAPEHPAPVVEAYTTGRGWREVGRGLEMLRVARSEYSAARLAR